MCDEKMMQELVRKLQEGRPRIDDIVMISTTQPYVMDYKNRKHIYIWSPNTLTISIEDFGNMSIDSYTWTDLSLMVGMRVFATLQTTAVPLFVRCTDDRPVPNLSSAVTSVAVALTPYPSNPTTTAAAGADTTYAFGPLGLTQSQHVSLQNNGTINIFFAFDQSTTVSTNQVYTLAPGQFVGWDRNFQVLHFSSASPVGFGGTSGITVEAFP